MNYPQKCDGKGYIKLEGWLGCFVLLLIFTLCAACVGAILWVWFGDPEALSKPTAQYDGFRLRAADNRV